MHIECNNFPEFRSYLIPLVVQVADDGVGFVHEIFPFVERRRERAERGAALPVPLDDVLVHGHLEVGIWNIGNLNEVSARLERITRTRQYIQ